MDESEDSSSERQGKRKRGVDDKHIDDEESIGKTLNSSDARLADASATDSRVQNGLVNVNLSSLVENFTCPICSGLYKNPLTITECLHTFCRSCLYKYFTTGVKKCPHPKCGMPLQPDPYKDALQDRTLESLVDKVLFVNVKEEDDVHERNFYAKRGIRPKPEFARGSTMTTDKAGPVIATDDEIDLFLEPDEGSLHRIPPLKRPHLCVSGRARIVHLKKYLLRKLNMPEKDISGLDLKCRNEIVGNDHSLRFAERTIWMNTEPMILFYRFTS